MRLRISIKDTGCGIPKDKQALIFNAFQQADGPITRSHGGTGLGLSISKQLISAMGGELLISSVVGKGSTFYFELSLKKAPIPKDFDDNSHILASLKNKTCLLIDDDNVATKILESSFKRIGLTPITANSPNDALSLLNEHPHIELCSIDLMMPSLDGFSLLKSIKKNITRTIRAIAITADMRPNTIEHTFLTFPPPK